MNSQNIKDLLKIYTEQKESLHFLVTKMANKTHLYFFKSTHLYDAHVIMFQIVYA